MPIPDAGVAAAQGELETLLAFRQVAALDGHALGHVVKALGEPGNQIATAQRGPTGRVTFGETAQGVVDAQQAARPEITHQQKQQHDGHGKQRAKIRQLPRSTLLKGKQSRRQLFLANQHRPHRARQRPHGEQARRIQRTGGHALDANLLQQMRKLVTAFGGKLDRQPLAAKPGEFLPLTILQDISRPPGVRRRPRLEHGRQTAPPGQPLLPCPPRLVQLILQYSQTFAGQLGTQGAVSKFKIGGSPQRKETEQEQRKPEQAAITVFHQNASLHQRHP